MSETHYVGQELDVFAHAVHWKRYWSSQIEPYLRGDVLEVGAGLGANTPFLHSPRASTWTCLEPDQQLADRMKATVAADSNLSGCQVKTGTLRDLDPARRFDAILYIDVLEHIEDDRAEMALAYSRLNVNGRIIVLAPAHPSLYTAFDKAIGHFRRYNRASLTQCTPPGCRLERMAYLDAVGMLASLGNRLLLRQSDPSLKQILTWDRLLVPLSRWVDPITFHRIGKSIVGVWKKTSSSEAS